MTYEYMSKNPIIWIYLTDRNLQNEDSKHDLG